GRALDGRMPSGECGYSELPCPTTDVKEPRTIRFRTIQTTRDRPASPAFRWKSLGRGGPPKKSRPGESVRTRPARRLYYFVILLTTPEPTVRPPSRIAKRRPSSMAIG